MRQHLPRSGGSRSGFGGGLIQFIQRRENVLSCSLFERHVGQLDQQRSERRAAEIRHDQNANAPRRIVGDRIHRHDVRVLQPRQQQVLGAVERRDLEHDRATGQFRLRREIDSPARSAADVGDQAKVPDRVANHREHRDAIGRLQHAVTVEHHLQRSTPFREAPQHIVRDIRFTGRLSQTKLFVNDVDGRFGRLPQFRELSEILFRRRPFAAPPTLPHLASQLFAKRCRLGQFAPITCERAHGCLRVEKLW